VVSPPIASTARGLRRVFIRDLVLQASIGVHPHEHVRRQRVRVNLDLAVIDDGPGPDHLSHVVDYEAVASRVRGVVEAGHVRLAETLAERIAEVCLVDSRVKLVRVRVEKLDIFADAEAVGVEIERRQPKLSTRGKAE
jgi:7,8-dihydroneopterin aldolase/epimerase/oxygenase